MEGSSLIEAGAGKEEKTMELLVQNLTSDD